MELRQLRYFVAVASELHFGRAVDALLAVARSRDWLDPPTQRWWTPGDDPHRDALEKGLGLR